MTTLTHLAFIGNSLPRRCGIATFTTDLQQAVLATHPGLVTSIVAMTDPERKYDYPPEVGFEIHDDQLDDYVRAADYLNNGQFGAVSLQHEFGIFGGEAGGDVMTLLSRLKMPIITTLHTVLSLPTTAQRNVLEQIIAISSKIVVMAEKGRQLLLTVYGVDAAKIEVIPHGIPDFAFVEPDLAKIKLGFSDRPVILTFGLLSPNKGIEFMIDAMPAILKNSNDAVYVVLGATHPNLVRDQGEAYRESLVARVAALGIRENVVFLDQFVDKATLLRFISMCDVYVTPYLNEAQMTSGTLAYSFGLGKAVVSTPYWHAQELLADGRGILVPFSDADAMSAAISGLLTDKETRQKMRIRAYAESRSMTWERAAENYFSVCAGVIKNDRLRVISNSGDGTKIVHAHPPLELSHFLSMCDDTGLFQHAVHSVPDRSHGYCVDDNARALLLACALNNPGEKGLPTILTSRLASFIQHAWNPDTRRFRNFMSFDRTWLEAAGSEDSHGRTLWALGECARSDGSASRRRWAAALFAEALPVVPAFTSPRAWAFTLLGLNGYCAVSGDNSDASDLRHSLAKRLLSLLSSVETRDWIWFEEGLSYDNARLPQALIATGSATGTQSYIDSGLRSLHWLMKIQTSSSGLFRPVGTEGFSDIRQSPQAFDQQPVEATATISACLAAWRADGDIEWKAQAANAFAWFLGKNDLGISLIDLETGSCRDGLHMDRPNENRGGESVVSYLLSLAEIRQVARTGLKYPEVSAIQVA